MTLDTITYTFKGAKQPYKVEIEYGSPNFEGNGHWPARVNGNPTKLGFITKDNADIVPTPEFVKEQLLGDVQ